MHSRETLNWSIMLNCSFTRVLHSSILWGTCSLMEYSTRNDAKDERKFDVGRGGNNNFTFSLMILTWTNRLSFEKAIMVNFFSVKACVLRIRPRNLDLSSNRWASWADLIRCSMNQWDKCPIHVYNWTSDEDVKCSTCLWWQDTNNLVVTC